MRPTGTDERTGLLRGVSIGAAAGLVGILCCVSPVVLVLLGLSSVSFAISLGNTLYYQYGWYFRGAAVLTAAVGVYIHLKGERACSVEGLRARWKMLAAVAASMIAVYLALYYLTTWLGRAYA